MACAHAHSLLSNCQQASHTHTHNCCLTPSAAQAFHNYDTTCDIFNHSNLIYWQISLPGLDGWNNISCTGTNFVVRARAAQEVCLPFHICKQVGLSAQHPGAVKA